MLNTELNTVVEETLLFYLYADLFDGAKNKTIVKKFSVSPTQITHLY